jgi:hypothetical protein
MKMAEDDMETTEDRMFAKLMVKEQKPQSIHHIAVLVKERRSCFFFKSLKQV